MGHYVTFEGGIGKVKGVSHRQIHHWICEGTMSEKIKTERRIIGRVKIVTQQVIITRLNVATGVTVAATVHLQ
jgi:hypothetical protein